jgi:hypothetical protein
MTPGRIAHALAVIAVVCVLAVFFFHPIEGPYPAVHGPVTALLSARAAAGLRLAIMHAGLTTLAALLSSSLILVSWAAAWNEECTEVSLAGACNSILRC